MINNDDDGDGGVEDNDVDMLRNSVNIILFILCLKWS